jgi:diguanylate cyclase (GGDEF)-like protein/PAS domain S-box-containing protein
VFRDDNSAHAGNEAIRAVLVAGSRSPCIGAPFNNRHPAVSDEMPNELMIARALTWRYVIALTLVATLASAAWISLHLVISAQKSTAAVVNVSGRQRMLSQRTALFSSLLVNAPSQERPALRLQLQQAADLMQRSHLGLTRGDEAMGLPRTMSDTVRAMYFEGPNGVDGLVADYLKSVHALLQAEDKDLAPDNLVFRHIIAVSPTTLVSSLDKVVLQYQLEGEQAIGRMQVAETAVWLMTLLLLVLEAKFIFHPFTQRMRLAIASLQNATDSLFESKERLRIVTENANDWLWETDPLGAVTAFTSRSGHLVSREAIVGRSLEDVLDTGDGYGEADTMFTAIATRQPYRDLVFPIRAGASGTVWVRASAVPHLNRKGDFLGYLGVWTDITLSKQLENEARSYQDQLEQQVELRTLDLARKTKELAESEEKFRLISSSANEGIIIIGPNGRVGYWNPAASKVFGYEESEVLDRDLHELLAPARNREDARHGFTQFCASGQGPLIGKMVEVMALRKSGEEFPVELSLSRLLLNGQWHALGVVRDISERRQAEVQIRQLAYYDTLTELPNRRLLLDRLGHALTQAKRHQYSLALMFLDLDHFKQINDDLGHDVGDELLKAVAKRLSVCVRRGDTVSRQGGDEFVVVLERIEQAEDASQVADKIIAAIKEPLEVDGHVLHVTVSLGIAIFQPDGEVGIQDLMKQADMAMYAAKQAGRNCWRYFEARAAGATPP